MRKIIVAAALLSMVSVTTVWSQAEVGPSANGHGNLVLFGGQQTLSFHARQFRDGTVSGSLVVKSRGQNARLFADLNCLSVVLNTAVMSGVVVKSDNPTLVPEGSQVFFRVMDNGEGANDKVDMMTDVLVLEPPTSFDCDNPPVPVSPPWTLMPIEEGNIQVRPTLFSLLQ